LRYGAKDVICNRFLGKIIADFHHKATGQEKPYYYDSEVLLPYSELDCLLIGDAGTGKKSLLNKYATMTMTGRACSAVKRARFSIFTSWKWT
jgi:hypothetical protein